MAEYIKNVIIVGVVSAMSVMLLPKGAEQTGRYVRQIAAFALLTVILAPLKNISGMVEDLKNVVSGITEFESTKQEYADSADAVIGKSAETISKYIINVCTREFNTDETKMRVKLVLDEADTENVIIKEIQVFAVERDRELLYEIESYLKELFETEVHVFGG